MLKKFSETSMQLKIFSLMLLATVALASEPKDQPLASFAYHNGVAVGGYWLEDRPIEPPYKDGSQRLGQTGEAYVYDVGPDGQKRQTALYPLIPTSELPRFLTHSGFGFSVGVFNDTIAVGTMPLGGAVYLFKRDQGQWRFDTKVSIPGAFSFGHSLAIADGYLIVGAPEYQSSKAVRLGAAFIFKEGPSGWVLERSVIGQHEHGDLGWSVAVSDKAAVIGSPRPGEALIVKHSGETRVLTPRVKDPWVRRITSYGISVAVSGDVVAVGAYTANGERGHPIGSGEAYIYSVSDLNQFRLLHPPTPVGPAEQWFGRSVAISQNGELLAVGAPGERTVPGNYAPDYFHSGVVYLYSRKPPGMWSLDHRITYEVPHRQELEMELGRQVGFIDNHVFALADLLKKVLIFDPSGNVCNGLLTAGKPKAEL